MFRTPTTLVVGAGASLEYGLPLGSALTAAIADLVDIRFVDWGRDLAKGDQDFVDALRQISNNQGKGGNVNDFIPVCRAMANAMPLAQSIDNYLDAHQHDAIAVKIGKIAIVQAILKAESSSTLNFDFRTDESFDMQAVRDTWLVRLTRALTEGVTRSKVESIFDNLTIISFNYDRCIKHFLKDALQFYYSLNSNEACELFNKLKIFYPYGSVGKLYWENSDGTRYGTELSGSDLLLTSEYIATFSERISDTSLIEDIKNAANDAENLVFLGFGFHRQNVDLISRPWFKNCKRIFATRFGISSSDLLVIDDQLRKTFSDENQDLQLHFHNGSSTELFDSYWRSLIA